MAEEEEGGGAGEKIRGEERKKGKEKGRREKGEGDAVASPRRGRKMKWSFRGTRGFERRKPPGCEGRSLIFASVLLHAPLARVVVLAI